MDNPIFFRHSGQSGSRLSEPKRNKVSALALAPGIRTGSLATLDLVLPLALVVSTPSALNRQLCPHHLQMRLVLSRGVNSVVQLHLPTPHLIVDPLTITASMLVLRRQHPDVPCQF
jgi:hypothetical protein